MQTPTLSVKEYQGIKIYIRRLFRETFEYLIIFDGELYCNQVEIQRPAGQRMTKYSQEDTDKAIDFMFHVAQDWCLDAIFRKEEYNKFSNRVKRFKSKVENKLFHYKYKLIEFYESRR